MLNDHDSPPRRRLTADQRRSQILEAARQLFIEEGVVKVSMRRIAARAGVTPTLIYHHFADKESLLLAVCEDFFLGLIEASEASLAATLATDEPFARLRHLMRGYVDFGLANPDVYRLVFMTPLAGLKREKLSHHSHRARPGDTPPPEEESFGMRAFALLEDEIRRLIEAGALKPAEAGTLAEIVWAAGHGIVSLLITHGDFQWTATDALITLSIDSILHGIAA
ncbi:TetR/AcrR family transcriptional regulator [Zavarzinia compransoris]|uniref:TetR/AcrR family transcriptional regulator n=1 Tax=Zavarzinia marina TaxID=2911065 RepID=UPI001F293481|nr:TetR/AcrR family transcriptional regulator [Zavarzinia marina]MCF4166063.1 TetR/AcrR family transcriptional regulator [Zavarzinia marina]